MSELNPEKKIVQSDGIDLPLMKVYLVGRISGNSMEKCIAWRKKIINHYKDYKKVSIQKEVGQIFEEYYESYPIAFICPLASGESKTADKLGLKSHLPKTLIYDKDILSLKHADVIVANLDDFMEDGLDFLSYPHYDATQRQINLDKYSKYELYSHICSLEDKIKNRRPNLGSHYEVSVALDNKKPVILIAGNEHNKYVLENHPFFGRASVVVLNTEQLLKEKWLQVLYKAMAGSLGIY